MASTDRHAYAAVRRTSDSGNEWIDIGSINDDLSMVRDAAKKIDDHIPGWAKFNPVVRFAQVLVSEIHCTS